MKNVHLFATICGGFAVMVSASADFGTPFGYGDTIMVSTPVDFGTPFGRGDTIMVSANTDLSAPVKAQIRSCAV